VVEELRIRFLDVGQGDAIVGILPGGTRAFVVDVCDAQRVLDFLEAERISEVVLFLTHSDRDHTKGAQDFLAELTSDHSPIRVLAIIFSQDRIKVGEGGEYQRLAQFIGKTGQRLSRNDPRDYFNEHFTTGLNRIPTFARLFDPVRITVVHPAKEDQDCLLRNRTNETAGVLLVEHEIRDGVVRRALLTADVQLTGISLILDRIGTQSIEADVLKFPHHGAWPTTYPGFSELDGSVQRRTMEEFFRHVMPSVVVFSVGRDNRHGHIRSQVFSLLTKYHSESDRLRSIKWTQRTSTCGESDLLHADSKITGIDSEGDVEVRLGEFADDNFIAVR
jgi:beta-lactamase superfamily II metal-dependent hydrolase